MSRVGKSPIALSKDVKASLKDGVLTVQGPKATLERVMHPAVIVEIDSEVINVKRIDESIETRSLHGLFRMLISNMVTGVTKGFTKVLEVKGTGYKFEMKGDKIGFSLGFSHPVEMKLPKGISAEINKTNNELTLTCADKELLGDFAAKIKKLRPVEPYKGKGIFYKGQVIRRKAGKAAGK
ncbi:MAG TPA: 50S ribosomal protein L6 [bacterium]|nr:50S ribosomal protein L6 [bacterium]HQN72448.1 50S ribosomal protein L6 [bacterium]HQO91346.1 50S ribosomal protein L6 [bacterium]